MQSKIPGARAPKPAINGTAGDLSIDGGSSAACDDPIGESIAAREKQLGGISNNVTDAEAKKKNIPVYRAQKHSAMVKGPTLMEFIESDKGKENTPANSKASKAPISAKATP